MFGSIRNSEGDAKGVDNLVTKLRNKTITAHGFEGVSEKDITEVYGLRRNLIEDLRTSISAALDQNLSPNPFFDLAEKLKF